MTEEAVAIAKLGMWARLRLLLTLGPGLIRLPFAYSAALDEVLNNDLATARKRLIRLVATTPEFVLDRFPIKLLLARTLLETGDPAAAAALFPQAFRPTAYSRSLSNAERAFLKYAGNDIYERASRQIGLASSFDTKVEFDELDVAQVADRLRRAFPIRTGEVQFRGAASH